MIDIDAIRARDAILRRCKADSSLTGVEADRRALLAEITRLQCIEAAAQRVASSARGDRDAWRVDRSAMDALDATLESTGQKSNDSQPEDDRTCSRS